MGTVFLAKTLVWINIYIWYHKQNLIFRRESRYQLLKISIFKIEILCYIAKK